MARASKSKKSSSVSVNFKGVETRVMLPENDYLLTVHSLESEDEQCKIGLTVMSGKFEGKKVTEYFSLKPQALWRLGNFIAACGLEVPNDEVELDASDFAEVTVMGVCTHDEYEGKAKMRWDFYGADEADEKDEDDEKDDDDKDDKKSSSKKADKKSSGKKAKEIEKVSAETVNESDEDELETIVTDTGIDCDLDDIKTLKKKRAAVIAALTEADLLEGDDEADEDDEKEDKKTAGKKDKAGKKSKTKKVDGSEVEDMDEDALGELITEHELEVDLDDHKTLRKKVRAVMDALEEKGLLEE